jgi:hypothetical protein
MGKLCHRVFPGDWGALHQAEEGLGIHISRLSGSSSSLWSHPYIQVEQLGLQGKFCSFLFLHFFLFAQSCNNFLNLVLTT